MSEKPLPPELPPPYDITEPQTKEPEPLKLEQLLKHKLFKSIFRQFELYRQLYHEADNEQKPEIMKRFKEAFSIEHLIEQISNDQPFDERAFAELLLSDNQYALNELASIVPGGPDEHQMEAGILVYELRPSSDQKKKLVIHLPAYKGDDLLADLRESFAQLATVVKEDESIKRVEGYSVLIGKKAFQKKFLPKDVEFVEGNSVPDDEEGFSGSQQASLLFNRAELKHYLTTGEKPKSIGVKINRDVFLNTYLS